MITAEPPTIAIPTKTLQPEPYATVDSIVQANIDQRQFSGVVMIADQGMVTYQRAAGRRALSDTSSIDGRNTFSIASVTKMVTSILVMQLEAQGFLSLDDPVARWLPEIDLKYGREITIHHLLLHISGRPNEPEEAYRQPMLPGQWVDFTLAKGGQRPPGNYNYANVDYILLGLIIERVTGRSWKAVVGEQIIKPLGLTHTGFLTKGKYPDGFAFPYQVTKAGEEIPDPQLHIENYYAAGCMYSTAADLLRLDQAMYRDDFLPPASRGRMFTSYPEYNYTGYGVWTYRYPFVPSQPLAMERRGGILGANVVLVRLLELNKTIIILSNNNRFNPDSFGDASNLREAILRAIVSG